MPDIPLVNKPDTEPKKLEDIFELDKKEAPVIPEAQERPVEAKPDKTVEARPEAKPEITTEDETARRRYSPAISRPTTGQPAKSEDLIKIENILSSHLDDIFIQMSPQQQVAFKQKGEETASKIAKLLRETKVRVKEILNLIKDWLKMMPGINKFFLEQEAKIKTDRLLNIREQKQK